MTVNNPLALGRQLSNKKSDPDILDYLLKPALTMEMKPVLVSSTSFVFVFTPRYDIVLQRLPGDARAGSIRGGGH